MPGKTKPASDISDVGTLVSLSSLDAAGFDPICIFDWSFPGDGACTACEVVSDGISVGAFAGGRGECSGSEDGMEYSRIGYDWNFRPEKCLRHHGNSIDLNQRVACSVPRATRAHAGGSAHVPAGPCR